MMKKNLLALLFLALAAESAVLAEQVVYSTEAVNGDCCVAARPMCCGPRVNRFRGCRPCVSRRSCNPCRMRRNCRPCRPKRMCCQRIRCCRPKPACCGPVAPACPAPACVQGETVVVEGCPNGAASTVATETVVEAPAIEEVVVEQE